ncbi:ATP-binding protein [Streptomyces coelicoflavus]|uniref:ATP-binding protein n=1 Tax=Streptomyces coelicoflavus TaxID=285562 RepID=UPI00369F7BDB
MTVTDNQTPDAAVLKNRGKQSGAGHRLSLLTYADLAEAATRMQAGATKTKAGWENLRALLDQLQGENAGALDPTQGEAWSIKGLRLCGFQGTTSELSMTIDPSPGISIYHGPNGSGKSTIADGIRTAMSGKTGWWTEVSAPTGRSKFDPLWEKINRARDSSKSWAEVTLVRTGEELTLKCVLTDGGEVSDAYGEWRTSSAEVRPVDMGSTWRHALEGHPPVFSYAEVERRVQRSNDLQRYIANLLALGGAFTHLEALVSELSEAASASKKKIDVALRGGKVGVAEVDRLFRLDEPAVDMGDISWPEIADSIEDWLIRHKLVDGGSPTVEVTSVDVERLRSSLSSVDAAFQKLEGVPELTSPRITQHLDALHKDAVEVAPDASVCPVCNSAVDNWVHTLQENVERHAALSPIHEEMRDALSKLRDASVVVSNVAEVLELIHSSTGGHKTASANSAVAAERLRAAMSYHGSRPALEVRDAFLALRNSVNTAGWGEASSVAVEASEVTRKWLRERRGALENFLHVWRTEQETAKESALWQETKKCSVTLADKLRKERTERFKERADKRVRQLLEDVGIYLNGIHLTTTRADVSVSNSSGQELQLSMLSAGQRNAFLLAPLLSTAESGPFSFLILDDPVHAFDEIRVDRLASVLVDLSSERRVIVFTHDERLKQHLLARAVNGQAWRVSRDVEKGEIDIESTDEMWRVLLDDARNIVSWAPRSSPTAYLTEGQVVRGLCRQAVDHALHSCVVRYSLTQGQDVARNLESIDLLDNTLKRVEFVEGLINATHGGKNPIDEFNGICGPYLRGWNRAVHGSDDAKADLNLELDKAREGCALITSWEFS